MNDTKTGPGPEELKKALKTIQEAFLFSVQERKDGLLWETVTSVTGKDAAYVEMQRLEKLNNSDWRVIPKNEADRLAEGIRIGKELVSSSRPKRRSKPKMYMPDNL